MSSPVQQSPLILSGGPLVRKPGLTRGDFSDHWLRHGALVSPFFEKYGVHEYRQLHLPSQLSTTLTEDERVALEGIDGIAFVRLMPSLLAEGMKSDYYKQVIVPDERRFLHEESGSAPVKRNPPAFSCPTKSVQEWRALALKAGATEHHVVVEGKSVVDVLKSVRDDWERLNPTSL